MAARNDIFVYEPAAVDTQKPALSVAPAASSSATPTTVAKRTARACVRCRRQKLKCDSYRPCALCVRANVACISRPESESKKSSTSSPPSAYSLVSNVTSSSATSHLSSSNSTTNSSSSASSANTLPSMASLTESMRTGLPPPPPSYAFRRSFSVADPLPEDIPPASKLQRLSFEDSRIYPSSAHRPRSLSFPNSTRTDFGDDQASSRLPPLSTNNSVAAGPLSVTAPSSTSTSTSAATPFAHVRSESADDSGSPQLYHLPPQHAHPPPLPPPNLPAVPPSAHSLIGARSGSLVEKSGTPSNSVISDIFEPSPMPWLHSRPSTIALLSQLPPRPLVEYAIAVYFNSFHWFVFVVHQGPFMEQYRSLIHTYETDPANLPNSDADFSTVLLIMTIVSLGASNALMHPVRRKHATAIYQSCLPGGLALAHASHPKLNIDLVISQLVSVVRIHLFDILSCGTIASVQSCVLLSYFYLHHGNPSLAWTIAGSAIKSAQSLGLHRESTSASSSSEFSDSKSATCMLRRRVFWALYNLDRLTTISYGMPAALIDNDCDVGIPSDSFAFGSSTNFKSSSVNACASLTVSSSSSSSSSTSSASSTTSSSSSSSSAPSTNGHLFNTIPFVSIGDDIRAIGDSGTTLLTYQSRKAQFYIIVGEIISQFYQRKTVTFQHHTAKFESTPRESPAAENSVSAKIEYLVSTAQRLEAKLKAWYDELPSVLKLEDGGAYGDGGVGLAEIEDVDDDERAISGDEDPAIAQEKRRQMKNDLFAVEALQLQLAYDNAMILVHRPLLGFSACKKKNSAAASDGEDPFSQSADTCWRSALRSSKIAQHPIFSKSQQTHAIAFVGMHLFTAGVLLSIFGSSEPLSQRALESKLGLSRIIQMRKALKKRVMVSESGLRVLENLARVVIQKEMEKILSGDITPSVSLDQAASKGGSDDDRTAAATLTSLSYQLAHTGDISPKSASVSLSQSLSDAAASAAAAAAAAAVAENSSLKNGKASQKQLENGDTPLAVIAGGISVVENRVFTATLANLQSVIFEDDKVGEWCAASSEHPQQAWIWSLAAPLGFYL
ncbi:fungal-specific transcription factor domain-containing protein [Myxozyma melibiosi]|uniref:Fungal-specific transcription factor domain-containing protein n=1 Tax=Myxozyma melibiosi TaxID=54550 RepID=A0ABR1EY08_9ASCO